MNHSENEMTGIEKRLKAEMKDPVSLLLFIPEESAISVELTTFVKDLATYTDNINFEIEKTGKEWNERMKDLKIEYAPCIVLTKDDFTRIRYFGLPTDHQIPPLVDALIELSKSETPISVKSKALLSTVLRRANIKVFVLPSCVYCPIVVRHSYRAAIESTRVTTEIIDSSIFTDWAYRHGVMGVPKVILNDSQDITGSLEEIEFFDKLRDADHALIDSMFR